VLGQNLYTGSHALCRYNVSTITSLMTRNLLCLVAASILANAEPPNARLSVPLMGYVFDSNAKALRTITGVPGVAALDGTIQADASIDSAFVHSRARVAFANTKDGTVALIQWYGSPRTVSIGTALNRITQVAFSPSGDRAAITDGTAIEVWSGLNGDPAQTASFTPDGSVAALAIKEDGTLAAATNSGAILVPNNGARTLASRGDWIALAFLPNGNLVAADGTSQNLLIIQDSGQDSGESAVLAHLDRKPLALAISVDGTRAAVAAINSITLVRLDGSGTNIVACNCQASRLEPLAGNLVLQLVDSQSGLLFILDADSAETRIINLPALSGGVQ
jgi:WD40 repeat protein